MSEELLYLNGIDAETGGPLNEQPIDIEIIAKVARGQRITPEDLHDAAIRKNYDEEKKSHFGVGEGIDNTDLAQTGWGVIFPASLPQKSADAIKDALKPLLDLRKKQATTNDEKFYREFIGPENGYKNGESKNDFLKRFGRGPGPADPATGVPYYLMIVGSPETIPFTFQYQLDVQYGVGRIYFEKLEDYARYANSVVQAETQNFSRAKTAAFFGVANPGDMATKLSAESLIKPLANAMKTDPDHADWTVDLVDPLKTTKDNLANYLGGKNTPALLFTASHGMVFKPTNELLLRHQGAILCQDWPGMKARQPITDKFYFSADDISADADVFGMFAFVFACYGGGTPKMDNFYNKVYDKPKEIAPYAFMSQLPLKLLSHPKGGALGVFAHVERAWSASIKWDGTVEDTTTFDSTVKGLLNGKPAGAATEYFNERYAEITTMLTEELDNTAPENQNSLKIAGMWTSSNDSRNYVFIGDPAVRLAAGSKATAKAAREKLGEIISKAAPASIGFQPDTVDRAPAAPQTPSTTPPATNYGISDLFKKEEEKTEVVTPSESSSSLKKFTEKLTEYLSKALDDATSLQVFTYVAEDLKNVTYENGKFGGEAKLRAMTRVSIDGDTQVCIPEKDGEVDTAVWDIHLEMLKQAQISRTELMKTLINAATGLANIVK